jgi:hypothetical protein
VVTEVLEQRQFFAAFLTGSAAPVDLPIGYNLTREGVTDWAHWNAIDPDGSPSTKIHKTNGGDKISNLDVVGSGGTNYGAYTDPNGNEVAVTWANGDGTANPNPNPEKNKIYMNANASPLGGGYVAAGWSFTVPADTTSRTLYVLGGRFSAATQITAHLSDSSAADYTFSDTNDDKPLYRRLYTIEYEAASAGSLTITFTKTANQGGITNGSVDLLAAWLRPTLRAVAVSSSQINLTWRDSSSSEKGFKIDYSTDPNFAGATTVVSGENTNSKWITGLSANTPYYFRVRTVNSNGTETANSDRATAKTPQTSQTTRNVVTQYGADPTGTNDSSDDIQEAINASAPGDTIYFPAGTYLVNDAILAKGEGRIYKGVTDVYTNSSGVTVTTSQKSILRSTGSDPDLVLGLLHRKNAVFYANDNRPLNDISTSFNVHFQNLTLEGRGIFLDQANGIAPMEGVVVEDCHFDVRVGTDGIDTGGMHGIQFTTGLKDSSIINNLFNVGGETGITGLSRPHSCPHSEI